MKFRPVCAVTLLLLAACGSDSSPGQGAGEAAGEVMEGTISDAMLPIDQTRSQPPLAEPAAGEGDERGNAAETGTPPSAEASEDPETQEPAEADAPAAAAAAPAE